MDWQREMCGEVCRMDDRIAVVDDQGGWDVFDLGMNRLDGGEENDIETAKTRCEAWSKTSMHKRSIYYYTGDPMLDDLEFTSDDESEWASDPSYSTGWWVPNVTLTVQSGDGGETWDWVVEDRNTYPPTHLIGQGFPDIAAALIDFKRSVQGRFGHIASRNSRAGSKEARAHRSRGNRMAGIDRSRIEEMRLDDPMIDSLAEYLGWEEGIFKAYEWRDWNTGTCYFVGKNTDWQDIVWVWFGNDDVESGSAPIVSTKQDDIYAALNDFDRYWSGRYIVTLDEMDSWQGPEWRPASKRVSQQLIDDDVYEVPAKYPYFCESPAGGAISFMSELANGEVLEVWSSDDHHGWVLYDYEGGVAKENMFDESEYDADSLIKNMCDDFFDPNNSAIAKRSQNFANSPRVPEEVDSKDDEPCPLCGSDHFDGKHCQTCGYDVAPDGLDDIDIDDLDEVEDVDQTVDDESVDSSDEEVTKDDGEDGASMSKSSGWWDDDPRKVMYEDDIVVLHGPDGSVWYKGIYDYSPMHDDEDYESGFAFNRDNGRYEHSDGSWYEKVGERRCAEAADSTIVRCVVPGDAVSDYARMIVVRGTTDEGDAMATASGVIEEDTGMPPLSMAIERSVNFDEWRRDFPQSNYDVVYVR